MRLPKWIWPAWIVVGVVLELAALATPGYGDTLSEFSWWLLALHPAMVIIGLPLAVWALDHIFRRPIKRLLDRRATA